MTKAIVLCANGSEELETVSVVDILRRAGVDVSLCAVASGRDGAAVKFSHGVNIVPDCHLGAAGHESAEVVMKVLRA